MQTFLYLKLLLKNSNLIMFRIESMMVSCLSLPHNFNSFINPMPVYLKTQTTGPYPKRAESELYGQCQEICTSSNTPKRSPCTLHTVFKNHYLLVRFTITLCISGTKISSRTILDVYISVHKLMISKRLMECAVAEKQVHRNYRKN